MSHYNNIYIFFFAGANVKTIEKPAGENFCLNFVERGLSQHRPAIFFITQGESSTGVYQPLEGLGALCHKYDYYFYALFQFVPILN